MKCEFCGAELPMNCNNCPSCGAPCKCIQPNAGVQPNTGVQPNGQQPYPGNPAYSGVQPKSRVTFILLGLFLGCLGIHNFYAGYNGKGIAQLLITLFIGWLVFPWVIVAIWALIEIIAVDVDAGNVKMI